MTAKIIPETYFLVNEQLKLFGGACLLGIPAGVIFDGMRLLRGAIPHHAAVTALEDIVVCLLGTWMLLCYIWAFGRCEFRMFYPFGMLLGWVMYECTVGICITGTLRNVLRRMRFGRKSGNLHR